MLHPATLQFLSGLKAHNHRDWLEGQRPAYEAAKADFLNLVTAVLADLGAADPAIAEAALEPKKCVFRQNRDVRFSANKDPYKTSFTAWFNTGGRKALTAGYYLHLEPGGAFVAGGIYMPEPAVLARLRQEIDYDLPAFESLLARPDFAQQFGQLSQENALKRPPKGYTPDNPALAHLRLKSFTANRPLPDAALPTPALRGHIGAAFAALVPLVAFCNRALD